MENLKTGVSYENLVSKYGKQLVDKEIELELEAKTVAFNNFMKTLNYKKANGLASETSTSITLISESIPVLSRAIQGFFDACNTGKAGKRHTAYKLVNYLEPEILAFITLKEIINQAVNSAKVPLSGLSDSIGKAIEDEVRYSQIFASLDDKGEKSLKSGLSKRVGNTFKRAYILAVENKLEDSGEIQKWNPYTKAQRTQVGLKFIELFISATGLGYLYKETEGLKRYYYFSLDSAVSSYIDYQDEQIANSLFIRRPMVIPPNDWANMTDGGYILDLDQKNCFIKIPKAKAIKLYNDVDMPTVYKAVNAIQKTAWRINQNVLKVAQEVSNWVNLPQELDMPSREPSDKPIKPFDIDTNEEARKEYRVAMTHWYQRDNSRKGKRLLYDSLLSTAEAYKNFSAIYFPHNIDFRGRVYPMTTLSPQGNDFGKGLLEFSEGIELGETGERWLALHTANCYGLDKKPLVERLEWVYENKELLIRIADNPLDNTEWMYSDSPWEFLACCFEWRDYSLQGEAFKSHLAVAFDGSCSGLQHFSAMLKDEVGGKAVNLIPSEQVQDIYKVVADKVVKMLNEDVKNTQPNEVKIDEDGNEYIEMSKSSLATEWLKYGVTRKVTKRSVMTLCYGSKKYGFSEQILEDTIYPELARNPIAFSRPKQAARYLAELIWEAVSEVVVKAVEAMAWLQDTSALLATDKNIKGDPIPTVWTTPAGFPVIQEYNKLSCKMLKMTLGDSIKINVVDHGEKKELTNNELAPQISCREPIPHTLDTRKQRQGIAPNFVHSMDASHLMLTVCACVDKGIDAFAMIHDSYGTHAGKADILFKTVREVFVKTYTEHDVLQELHDQVEQQLSPKMASKLKDVPSHGNLDLEQVLYSYYAFCQT